MRTVCCSVTGLVSSRWRGAVADRANLLAHAYVLRLLERLALGSDRGGDDHLGVLELGDVVGSADPQRGSEGSGEILAAVIDPGRTEQDLSQRRLGPNLHAGATWEVRVGCRHAPVVALGRRLFGAGEWRPDHHSVGSTSECLADVGADAHAAVGDDGDAHAAAT